MHDKGFVHGRFQILHHDHMKYILSAKERCRYLVIGVTNPEPSLTRYDETDPERSSGPANPYSFEERKTMLGLALKEAGIGKGDYSIIPFPVNFPELYGDYIPPGAVCFLTIYDNWGEKKLKMLESSGMKTEVLWRKPPSEKGITSTSIRESIFKNKSWEHLVPESVARHMKENDLIGRIAESRKA